LHEGPNKYDHSSSDNKAVWINKVVNLTKALKITPDYMPKPVAVSSRDVLLNIFTSGTTGMPKAVIMKNFWFTLGVLAKMIHISLEKNVVFTAIPMYYIYGGVAGVFTAFSVEFLKSSCGNSLFQSCGPSALSATSLLLSICVKLLSVN
jgi:acyl-coenzyme A synthetase/AMP-(fatty) acid ligase